MNRLYTARSGRDARKATQEKGKPSLSAEPSNQVLQFVRNTTNKARSDQYNYFHRSRRRTRFCRDIPSILCSEVNP